MNKEYIVSGILLIVALFGVYFFSPVSLTGNVVLLEDSANLTALDSLLMAEDDLKELQRNNISTLYIQDILLQAKRYFVGDNKFVFKQSFNDEDNLRKKQYLESLLDIFETTPDYELEEKNEVKVLELTNVINSRRGQVFELLDRLTIITEKEASYKLNNIDTSKGIELIGEARVSFNEERYDEASILLEQADLALEKSYSDDTRVKELVQLSKNFFEKYWWQLILIFILLVAITKPVIIRVQKMRARRKLIQLNLELKLLDRLMISAQKECFVEEKISVNTYKIRSKRYKTRIARIKHTLPVLQGIITGRKVRKKRKVKGVIEVKR